MKYHLILTLDYELFGNGSGDLRHCVTMPAQQCLDVACRFGARQTFFVDALEFHQIRRVLTESGDRQLHAGYAQVERQLGALHQADHRIQLHLHPQWQDATMTASGWSLDPARWRIGDLEPRDIDECIDVGLEYLGSLYPREQISTFRAGGWAIQPSAQVVESLLRVGITMDSTVARGVRHTGKADWFDFRDAPALPFWQVATDVCRPEPAGRLTEVPITTRWLGRRKHLKVLREHRNRPTLPEGCSGTYGGPDTRWQKLYGRLGKLSNIGTVMLDFSTLPAWALIEATQQAMAQYADHPGPVPLVAIGHNKNFSARSAENLAQYLAWAQRHESLQFSDYDRWRQALRS